MAASRFSALNVLAQGQKPRGQVPFQSSRLAQGQARIRILQAVDGLIALLDQVPELSAIEHWVSADRRAERGAERWLNLLWSSVPGTRQTRC